MMYAFLRWVMRSLVHTVLFGLFTQVGRERVPREGPLLVCANHISTLDPPLIPAFLPRNDSWSMAKAEYFESGGFKRWIFTAFHAFPVHRHSADRAAISRAMASLIFGVVSVDFAMLGGFTALLFLVALGAGYLPARRAIGVDPMVSLRYE